MYSGGRALKGQDLKERVSGGGGLQCCNTTQCEKTVCFLSTKACKHILVVN